MLPPSDHHMSMAQVMSSIPRSPSLFVQARRSAGVLSEAVFPLSLAGDDVEVSESRRGMLRPASIQIQKAQGFRLWGPTDNEVNDTQDCNCAIL